MMYGLYIWYCGSAPVLLSLYTTRELALQAGKEYKDRVIERKDFDEFDPEFDDLVVCYVTVDDKASVSNRGTYIYIT